jgi:hypothetical protein
MEIEKIEILHDSDYWHYAITTEAGGTIGGDNHDTLAEVLADIGERYPQGML